jgi:hypothetical protein
MREKSFFNRILKSILINKNWGKQNPWQKCQKNPLINK